MTDTELELIRRRLRLRAYSRALPEIERVTVGRPNPEDDIRELLDEVDRLRAELDNRKSAA